MPRLAACSRIANTIIVSVCGVLNTQAFLALIGSMIRADEASEITGVSPSATRSIIASVFGVVVEPMMASTLFSLISFLVLTTAALESLASSRTMYSIVLPATVFGSSAMVFFSGMPSEPAGPVVDRVTPILTWASAPKGSAAVSAKASGTRARRMRFIVLSPGDSLSLSRASDRLRRAGARGRESGRAGRAAPVRRAGSSGSGGESGPDRAFALDPRQAHADALMDARAEGDVPVRRACDVEPVGIRELFRVAVGRADAER